MNLFQNNNNKSKFTFFVFYLSIKICEIKELYNIQCNSMCNSFQPIYGQVLRMTEKMGTEPCQSRTVKRQYHRSNIQVDAVFDHYMINIAIPFLDHDISDLDTQFSRMFSKRNFRHICCISINSLSI